MIKNEYLFSEFEVDLIKNYYENENFWKTFFLLTAALVLAASLTLTACSDSDDGDSNAEESEQSTMPADANDDATVLGLLLATWVDDFTSQDVTPGNSTPVLSLLWFSLYQLTTIFFPFQTYTPAGRPSSEAALRRTQRPSRV